MRYRRTRNVSYYRRSYRRPFGRFTAASRKRRKYGAFVAIQTRRNFRGVRPSVAKVGGKRKAAGVNYKSLGKQALKYIKTGYGAAMKYGPIVHKFYHDGVTNAAIGLAAMKYGPRIKQYAAEL